MSDYPARGDELSKLIWQFEASRDKSYPPIDPQAVQALHAAIKRFDEARARAYAELVKYFEYSEGALSASRDTQARWERRVGDLRVETNRILGDAIYERESTLPLDLKLFWAGILMEEDRFLESLGSLRAAAM